LYEVNGVLHMVKYVSNIYSWIYFVLHWLQPCSMYYADQHISMYCRHVFLSSWTMIPSDFIMCWNNQRCISSQGWHIFYSKGEQLTDIPLLPGCRFIFFAVNENKEFLWKSVCRTCRSWGSKILACPRKVSDPKPDVIMIMVLTNLFSILHS
jgi:hypothetical protein